MPRTAQCRRAIKVRLCTYPALVRHVFSAWKERAAQAQRERAALAQCAEMRRARLQQRALDVWRDRLAGRRLSYEVYMTLAARCRYVMRQYFSTWLARTSVQPLVDLRQKRQLVRALRHWAARARAKRAASLAAASLQRDALRTWRAKAEYMRELHNIQKLEGHRRRASSDFRHRLVFVPPTARFRTS